MSGRDQAWLTTAVIAVERCLDRLVDDFLADPYRHRVEHCLHTDLVALLREQPELAGRFPLADGRRSQLVHKEWPELRPRPGKPGRGNVDVAVLSPAQMSRARTTDLLGGRITAPIVVELGLNYSLGHLRQDEAKLVAGQVEHPYLVHFSHNRSARALDVEAHVEQLHSRAWTTPRMRVAYAHVSPRDLVTHVKRLGEPSVVLHARP